MKLKINKAARDLNSISLPPHSRRPNRIGSGCDSGSRYQLRSTQGMSSKISQLTQNTMDDIMNIEQVLDTQERERISCLQMRISRSSNNCQDSKELEHRIGRIETTQNRHGMILESIQGDIMQVKKQVQENSLDIEGINQKLAGHDNSLQLVLKGEEDIKNTLVFSVEGIEQKLAGHDNSLQLLLKGEEDIRNALDERLNSLPDQLRKEVHQEIVSAITTLQNENKEQMLKLTTELSAAFANSVKAIASFLQPSNNRERYCHPTQSQNREPVMNSAVLPHRVYTRSKRNPKKNAITGESSKQRPDSYSNTRRSKINTPEEILFIDLDEEWRENNELDEELDGGFAYLLGEKEAGGSCFFDEDRVEAEQILKKARRNRKHSKVN